MDLFGTRLLYMLLAATFLGACSPDKPTLAIGPNGKFESSAVRMFRISVAPTSSKSFHARLDRLAQRHGMTISRRTFETTMENEVLKIAVGANDSQTFSVFLYRRIAQPLSDERVDTFFTGLIADLGSLNGAKVFDVNRW